MFTYTKKTILFILVFISIIFIFLVVRYIICDKGALIANTIYAHVNQDFLYKKKRGNGESIERIRIFPNPSGAIEASNVPYMSTIGGMGEGLNCSIPSYAEFLFEQSPPVSLLFRQACIYHDYCYRHGAATYNYTQTQCDLALQEQASRICNILSNEKDEAAVIKCETDAKKFLLAVRTGGAGSFRATPSFQTDSKQIGAEKHSTYFEFDSMPMNTREYVVTRLGSIPDDLPNKENYYPIGIYYFIVRPNGIAVKPYAININKSGEDVTIVTNIQEYNHSIGVQDNFFVSPPLGITKLDAMFWLRESTKNTDGCYKYSSLKNKKYDFLTLKKEDGERGESNCNWIRDNNEAHQEDESTLTMYPSQDGQLLGVFSYRDQNNSIKYGSNILSTDKNRGRQWRSRQKLIYGN